MDEDKPKRGRPVGRRYPEQKCVKLRPIDFQRLGALAKKLDRDQSWVIRYAVQRLAAAEGIELGETEESGG